ncbi:hemopexin repeat-containing protein [Alkalinema pantanalense CENA528]|uniref:hemopexin repeat-containing protein n=1 Tax=Alkalinema pantanalense TaxID=1620705 RepID=UPI003D6FACE9
MAANSDLPSYEDIFGSLDFTTGEDGRSVLSPSAYLVDLLQLLDDKLRSSSQLHELHQRRGDIQHILLNTENAFTAIPYLDIVNGILEQQIGDDVYTKLQQQQYPFQFPFNFENERIKKFLHYLNVSSEELYKRFSLELNPVLIGREYLQLSTEEFNAITQSPTSADLQSYFNRNKTSHGASSAKIQVANFLAATQLSGAELRELLYQNLSETAHSIEVDSQPERVKASDFFIHYGLGGYAVLDSVEASIIWQGLTAYNLVLSTSPKTPLPATGQQLIAIAKEDHDALHFRIFDHQEAQSVDLLEANLSAAQRTHLETLKTLLQPYWNSDVSSIPAGIKENILELVAVITNSSPIPSAWFDRVQRLIRLQRKTGLSLTELDLILRTCCQSDGVQSELDGAAIQKIAVIKHLCDRYEIAVDVACSFFRPMNTLGLGNAGEPADLFNRVFNGNLAHLDRAYIRGSAFVPARYVTYSPLICTDDILSVNNKAYRQRISQALGLSEAQLVLVVNQFRDQAKRVGSGASLLDEQAAIGLPALSLLFRLSQLTEILDLTYEDLFNLFDILGKDPAIRLTNAFDTLIPMVPTGQDCYRMIAGNDGAASMWLVQILGAIAQWLQTNDISTGELKQWLTPTDQNATEATARRQHKIEFLNNLYQQFQPLMFSADLFVSEAEDSSEAEAIDRRTARVIYQTFIEPESGLVARKDRRLVKYEPSLVEKAAYRALTRLDQIVPEDFTGLGLELKLLDALFNHLILQDYISPEGLLLEERFPTTVEQFQLETDFSAHRDDVFMIIHDLLSEAMEVEATIDSETELEAVSDFDEDGTDTNDDELGDIFGDELGDDSDATDLEALSIADEARSSNLAVELTIYPSDLEVLTDLSEKQRNELYDHLIFNGYLDEEGNVLQTDFFVNEDNVTEFQVNIGLTQYAQPIFNLILTQIQQFQQAQLTLDRQVFAELPLKPFEIDNLIENLIFNGYLDANHLILNKAALLTTTPQTLNLALAFYPHRRPILQAMQGMIREFKATFYTLNRDLFTSIADDIAARQVYQHLQPDYLRNGRLQGKRLEEEGETFFLDPDNLSQFVLSAPFSSNDTEIIFAAIQRIVTTAKKYQFNLQVLEELDFDWEEQEELIDILESTGYLHDRVYLVQDKISYFLRIDNALEFTLEGFEDYNKDIFFALHAIAKVIDADVQTIAAQFQALAEAQSITLLEALQDHLGVEADVLHILCQQILQDTNIVESLLVPVLAIVNRQDQIADEPSDNWFNLAYRRIEQFAAIAAKLGLNATETAIVWQDQNLVEKFPEKLALPPGVDRIDALLETQLADGTGVIYLFVGNQYWRYGAKTYQLLPPDGQPLEPPKAQPLSTLSPLLAELPQVDAALTEANGDLVLLAQGFTYRKAKGSDRWVKLGAGQPGSAGQPESPSSQPRIWGKVINNFENPQRVDATFQDRDGRTYLFSGDQYIRYSGETYDTTVDEGYPLKIERHWLREACQGQTANGEDAAAIVPRVLPRAFQTSIDAAFQAINGHTYWFKDKSYLCLESNVPEKLIHQTWGKVRNNFENLRKIDAAYGDGNQVFLFSGDQVIAYQDSLEQDQVMVQEGYPKRLRNQFPNLPAEFVDGVDAAFKAKNGTVYLFKGGTVRQYPSDQQEPSEQLVRDTWGRVRNVLGTKGQVDAAFVGLDGKTYLFSDDQYVRYSGADYAQVDDGFPRTIDQDWGGLSKVHHAFILDGKTYLFGTAAGQTDIVYVRYSTHDYTKVDPGYPKPPNDNWWNLPLSLIAEDGDFQTIEAVFNTSDDKIYLFSGDRFIYFDQQQRWWSEPQNLSTAWSLPFREPRVDAAFVGKDGKTYLFSGTEFIQYSGHDYSRPDDRSPNKTRRYWGYTTNQIAKTGRVDAVLLVDSHELDGVGQMQTTIHTYLFSGHQYFRYSIGDNVNNFNYAEHDVDEGYPKTIATSLTQEPRFKNLDAATLAKLADGIDAAFADRRQIYLFKGGQCYVVSENLHQDYGDLGLAGVSCALVEEGAIYLADGAGWQRHSSLEGLATAKTRWLPPCLRQVPDGFKTGLQAILHGRDRNTYLFQGSTCFNLSLNRAYPLAEEWGRVKNNIDIHNTVDAAFVGLDGKTYLFSGDQFVVYGADAPANPQDFYGQIEQLPRSIKDHWGGLNRVSLAFVKDGKTYLFEPADALGNARYVCYSSADYRQPDAGFPKLGDRSFWAIPSEYVDEEFTTIYAVLSEGENLFLICGQRYIQYDVDPGQWTYPKPLSRIWRDIPFNNDSFKRIKTAFTGRDGNTYFFAENHYVACGNAVVSGTQPFTSPAPINQRWGKVRNNFTDHPQGNRVDAAFVYQNRLTYLFSGDQYIRYSDKDYRYVDEGYPKTLAINLRQEPGFQNLPESFEEQLTTQMTTQRREDGRVILAVLANDRTLALLLGDRWHVVSQSLTATYPLSRLGRLKNNIAQRQKVDAALFLESSGQTFLFSGDQGVRYSDDTYTQDETPAFVDDGYPKSLATILTQELGMQHLPDTFQYDIDAVLKGNDGKLYVFKDKGYLRSDQTNSQSIATFWGKVNNAFVSIDPADPSRIPLDAAFISPNGSLYAFKGVQYIRYTHPDQTTVDEGFPKSIQDNWGNLPVAFETAIPGQSAISGGFVFEGKTYLLKDSETGQDYVRYSDATYQAIDTIYPQKVKYRWGNWSDYLLNDLYIMTRFKQLQDSHSSGELSLLDFLHPETGPVADPYAVLATLFEWDLEEVKWLKRKNAFLSDDMLFEVQFKLEIILRLYDIFTLAKKMGIAPRQLYTTIWRKRYSSDADEVNLKDAADALYRCLALIHSA